MSENNIDSDKTSFKVRLSGEDYHEIVIDWKDTSRPFKQQVFRQLVEITKVPLEYTGLFTWTTAISHWQSFENNEADFRPDWYSYEQEFNKGNVLRLMNGEEYFGLSLYMYCEDNGHFAIQYWFISERFINETECSRYFCHHIDTRAHLNKLKAIITSDVLHSQMKPLLVEPRYPGPVVPFHDQWNNIFRQFNIMKYYGKSCNEWHQYETQHLYRFLEYVTPQLYLRTRG